MKISVIAQNFEYCQSWHYICIKLQHANDDLYVHSSALINAIYDCFAILLCGSSVADSRFLMKQLACLSVAVLARPLLLSALTVSWITMLLSSESDWLTTPLLKFVILSLMAIHCVAVSVLATRVWIQDSGLSFRVSSAAAGSLCAADVMTSKPCKLLQPAARGCCSRGTAIVFAWTTLQPIVEADTLKVDCGIALGCIRMWRMVVWTAGITTCCLFSTVDLLMPGTVCVIGLQAVVLLFLGLFVVIADVQTGRSMKHRGIETGFPAAWVNTRRSGALLGPTSEMEGVLLTAMNLPLASPA